MYSLRWEGRRCAPNPSFVSVEEAENRHHIHRGGDEAGNAPGPISASGRRLRTFGSSWRNVCACSGTSWTLSSRCSTTPTGLRHTPAADYRAATLTIVAAPFPEPGSDVAPIEDGTWNAEQDENTRRLNGTNIRTPPCGGLSCSRRDSNHALNDGARSTGSGRLAGCCWRTVREPSSSPVISGCTRSVPPARSPSRRTPLNPCGAAGGFHFPADDWQLSGMRIGWDSSVPVHGRDNSWPCEPRPLRWTLTSPRIAVENRRPDLAERKCPGSTSKYAEPPGGTSKRHGSTRPATPG